MALTAQNDSGQSESTDDDKVMRINGRSKEQIGKTFVPNPKAEPFVPEIIKASKTGVKAVVNSNLTWNGSCEEEPTRIGKNGSLNGTVHITPEKLVNGLSLKMSEKMPLLMSHSSPNSEDEVPPLMISPGEIMANGHGEGENNSPMKKHIAFHLLSNLLDDEIVEDTKNVNHEVALPSKEPTNELFEGNESWPASVSSLSSSFSLNLDLNENSVQHSTSFTNRSIHEIWSPNPSPKGSYPSTPSEDSIPYFPSSHDNNLESPYHKGAIDIITGRSVVSPVLPSPGSTSLEYVLHQNGSVGGTRHYSPTYPIVNSNGCTGSPSPTSIHNTRNSFDHHPPPMNAIRALQFNGDEPRQNGIDDEILDDLPPSPCTVDDGMNCQNKVKKLQVHFEEHGKPRNGIIIKPKEEVETDAKEEMVTSAKKLGASLDECLDQLRHLEAESRRAEQELSKIYPSRRRLSSTGGCYVPRLPVNPTRVDKMIVEQSKVHDKIESLIGRIERMGRSPLHPNVGVALDQWLACIKELQSLRRDEIHNSPGSASGSYGCKSYYDRDLLALACCVKNLIRHTRAARTTIWCAMQMLHADECWLRRSESCSSLERNSDQLSSKS